MGLFTILTVLCHISTYKISVALFPIKSNYYLCNCVFSKTAEIIRLGHN